MGSVPFLKPAEVCRLLERLDSRSCANAVRPSNIAMLTGVALPSRCIRVAALPPSLLRQIARAIGLTAAEVLQKR